VFIVIGELIRNVVRCNRYSENIYINESNPNIITAYYLGYIKLIKLKINSKQI